MPFLKNKPKGTLSELTYKATITNISRAGKQILTHFKTADDMPYIWRIHLGHTGWWLPGNDQAKERTTRNPIADNFIHKLPVHTIRAMLVLSDGQIHHFYDPRTFSRWYVHTLAEWQEISSHEFGPDWMNDPLTAGFAVSKRVRAGARTHSAKTIKTLLLDQQIAAGLGNYLVCEILHRARVHPSTPISKISEGQLARIIKNVPTFIAQSYASFDHSHWQVFQRQGKLCNHCRTAYIERLPEGTRSSYFCPVCQPDEHLRS